jgi:hypothetical protein
MAAELVTIAKPAATTGEQTIFSGLSFKPRVVFCWTSGGLTTGTVRTSVRASIGAVARDLDNNQSQRCMSHGLNNVAGALSCRMQRSDVCIHTMTGDGTALATGVGEITDDGFIVDWTYNNTVDQHLIHYLAVGGSGFKAAKWLDLAEPNSTGSVGYTGAGFEPNLVFSMFPVIALSVYGSAFATGFHNVGAATETDQFSMYAYVHATSVNASRMHSASRLFEGHDGDTSTMNREGSLVSFDADGLTINWTAVDTGTPVVPVLLMQLDQVDVGTVQKEESATPTTDVTTGFEPDAVLLFSNRSSTLDSYVQNARFGMGALENDDGEYTQWMDGFGAQLNSFAQDGSDRAIVYSNVTGSTTMDQANGATGSEDADGFQLNWQGSSTAAVYVSYIAFGALGAGDYVPPAPVLKRSSFVFVG